MIVNPLLAISQKYPAYRPDDMDDEAWDKVCDNSAMETTNALKNSGQASKQLAVNLFKAAIDYGAEENYDADEGRHIKTLEECCIAVISDPFLSLLVAYALDGWWNDTVELACTVLGFEIEGNWAEQLNAFLEANPTFKPLHEQPGYAEAMKRRMTGE